MMEEQQEASGPATSCMSAGSYQSMGNPISFQKQPASTAPGDMSKDLNQDPDAENECIQPGSSAGRCDSLKSDWSMENRREFKPNAPSLDNMSETGLNQTISDLQCASVDVCGDQQRSEFQHPMPLSHIMKELKVRIGAFVESELNHSERMLNEESEEDPESTGEEEDGDTRSCKEAMLFLSTYFLRAMKQDHMAQCLLSRTKTVECMSKLKSNLKRRFQHVFEGVSKAGDKIHLNEIYTDLWITEGNSGSVDHEVRQIQTDARKHRDKVVKCENIFGNLDSGRRMLTKGVAGIGKTLCVQKVVLDWTEFRAHKNIKLLLPFSFRELNVVSDRSFSLVNFVQHFFPEIKEAGICSFDDLRVVFIFDGLDESRLNLDFQKCPSLTDTTESVPLNILLVNLIMGKLLPSAQLWITTRPAAANQIPPECVSMVTEVRGFTDAQKEQYFRKKFRDEQATGIIKHVKKKHSLHNMCYIPIFCWILSTVLEHVLDTGTMDHLPHTLTQMYIHLLVVQTKVKSRKYDGRSEMDSPCTSETKKMVLSLGKLAFEQLQKGNLIFYESDLEQCGLDTKEASVYSGVFTQIFKEEQGLYQDKVYCFIHLTVQEFLAALYVHLTFFNSGVNLLSEAPSTEPKLKPMKKNSLAEKDFYCSAVDKALQSNNGHLDLFLRFLLGLSLQSNQNLLQGFTKHIQPSSQSSREAAAYVKSKITEDKAVKDKFREDLESDKTINLFQCLYELGDTNLMEEAQTFLSSELLSVERLSSVQWSALVFILLSETCEVFELRKINCSVETFFRLLPVIEVSTESSLSGLTLLHPCCEALAKVLRSESCLLKRLDLSYTELQDSGLSTLAGGLTSPLSNLQVLRLRGCRLTEGSCRVLCCLLSSPRSALTQLDVSDNSLQNQGIKLLSEGLQSPHCTLATLRMIGCDLTSTCCEDLSKILQCHTSALQDLDLSNNQLQDLGIELLCNGLLSPRCNLKILRLSGCVLTEKGVSLLGSALDRLTELDLRYNHPGDSGIHMLSVAQERPTCSLTSLRTEHGGACRLIPGPKKYACELTMDLNTAHRELMWFENNCVIEGDVDKTPDQEGVDHFEFWHQILCREGLTGRCYWEVKWRGLVSIAVTYRGIQRKENTRYSKLGGNRYSWALHCSSRSYFALHNDIIEKQILNRAHSGCSRKGAESTVAVYLDWEEGVLSFFTVLPDGLELIHTFQSAFSEPLIPSFRLCTEFTIGRFSSVTLCPVQTR
ncbi:NACHT, LRR and PYD domains-containing protein 3-like [Eucyclogobius newberryi]|uniref:NACHT, LRR and PYD domains-containing protein 3-like n=1 Tax=Eucyclogobius newberryi TaxID=166745 RepID=UPI003B5B3767